MFRRTSPARVALPASTRASHVCIRCVSYSGANHIVAALGTQTRSRLQQSRANPPEPSDGSRKRTSSRVVLIPPAGKLVSGTTPFTRGKCAPCGSERERRKNRERKKLNNARSSIDNPHRRCSAWLAHQPTFGRSNDARNSNWPHP